MTGKKCEDCADFDSENGECKNSYYYRRTGSVCMFEGETGYTGCSEFKPDVAKKTVSVVDDKPKGNPKYDRTIIGKYGTGSCVVDAYRMIDACNITIPQLQHAAKKILFTGQRGHKDLKQDLIDILHSTQSALDMIEDKELIK